MHNIVSSYGDMEDILGRVAREKGYFVSQRRFPFSCCIIPRFGDDNTACCTCEKREALYARVA